LNAMRYILDSLSYTNKAQEVELKPDPLIVQSTRDAMDS